MAYGDSSRGRRLSTETRPFYRTSEFWMWAGLALALLIAGNTIEGQEGGSDYFAADKVWLYLTVLTVGYFISRGLAKSGVRERYWENADDGGDSGDHGRPLGERVKVAAKVLTDPDADPSAMDTQPTRETVGVGARPAGTMPPATGPGADPGRFDRGV
jgi:hypothetical protein